jgi:tetratricopeptide (TPR) repeat protein
VDAVLDRLSIKNLFVLLKNAEDSRTATVVSEVIEEIWEAHRNEELRHMLDTATIHTSAGRTESALFLLMELVDLDPYYADAWNKCSKWALTVGNLDCAMFAAQKALEIIPNHFDALNSIGQVCHERRDLQKAVDHYRRSMNFDPWSTEAPLLSACVSTLKRWEEGPRSNRTREPK